MSSAFLEYTPLLVPSFSSKGNLLIDNGGQLESDNYSLLKVLDYRVTNKYLISAYDCYYGFLPKSPEDYPVADFLFVDSGGYETNGSFESNEINKFNYRVNQWDYDKMKDVYKRFVECESFSNSMLIFSSFDTQGSLEEQVNNAQLLKEEFPDAIIDFLIKLGSGSVADLIGELVEQKEKLNHFSIIGFTEKELGDTVRERLINLWRLRQGLSHIGWNGSIHLFGGLEPNLAGLYYLAGADIFDGLSWQRIRYRDSSTLFNTKHYNIGINENANKLEMMIDNISVLREIERELLLKSVDRETLSSQMIECLHTGENQTIQHIWEEVK